MNFESFKIRMLNEAFNLAGMVIAGRLTQPDYKSREKAIARNYNKLQKVVAKAERERAMERPVEPSAGITSEVNPVVMTRTDFTAEKVQGGTACLPCSRDHLSTVSGALNEAIRFARREGIYHKEVADRVGMALDELNMLERIDLSSANIESLPPDEKRLANWGLEKSRELRHEITAVKNPDDLEHVASHAHSVRSEYMRKLWDLASVDGTIDTLCRDLTGKDLERCKRTVNESLGDKG
jgi:hypothetical protein